MSSDLKKNFSSFGRIICGFTLMTHHYAGEDWRLIDSVDEAETKLREFDDFLVTLDAQGEKRELVKRLTLIETKFAHIK